jgi:membrane associated rhomboid family serine protease
MFGVATSDDYRPVGWVGRYPIYITTLLVIVHVACMVVGCLLIAFGAGSILGLLGFDSAQVLYAGRLWQIATYAFVHSPSGLIWFAIEMYMLFVFGREVERFVGRRAFIVLYSLLLVVPTLVLTAVGFLAPFGLVGSGTLHLGVFLAFACIYPNVEMFMLRIQTKWIAIILVAISTLFAMAVHDWATMIVLWITVALAFLFVRSRGAGPELVWLNRVKEIVRPRPKLRIVQKPTARPSTERDDVYASIDPILDKISKFGIGSLTASERRQLNRERERLLKKPQ